MKTVKYNGQEVEAYSLIMCKENALDIVSGKKTLETRQFSSKYEKMFTDFKQLEENEKLRKAGRDEECQSFLRTDIEAVHFYSTGAPWTLDVAIDEIGIGEVTEEGIKFMHDEFDFHDGIQLGVMFTARVGGSVVSNTQGVLDYYGVSKESGDARDAGGIRINNGYVDAKAYYQMVGGSTGGIGQYYIYDATNVRLSELSLNYTLPRKWFNNKVGITAGLVGKNLWMIYCKAPFDPELTPSTTSNFYQGVDYFMSPSTRNIGFNVKFQF